MKIGILTYQRAHNYGALLQAFALKTWLETQGHDVEMIDYWPDYHSADYQMLPHFQKISFKGKIKSLVLLIVGIKKYLKRRRAYHDFIQNHLKLPSKPIYTKKDELKSVVYDFVIYGSDQIWRKQNFYLYKGFNEVYFGAYVKAKKISYAASMGILSLQQPEDGIFLKENLKKFEKISVREKELQDIIANLVDIKPELVLDPVFLLKKTQWIKYLPKTKVKEKYIFLYQLNLSEDSVHLADKLKKIFGYKVIEVLGRVNPIKVGSRYHQIASPFEFLSLINDAEFVVTTSFHGAAFSVLFEKQFYALGMKNNSGRVRTLLSSLGIKERYLECIEKASFDSKINYKSVSKMLQNNVNNSTSFLKKAICE